MDEAGTRRENNFDAIRIAAALTVVVGHSWSLTGREGGPRLAGSPIFDIAVWVFFSLSGYLVATSWGRDPHPGRFLARRVARIFPALVVVVVATTFLIGPAVSSMAIGAYFGSSQSWAYLTNVSLVASYQLPGVFENAARPVVNGSLWTLGPEFICYLVVLTIGLIVRRAGRSRPMVRMATFASIGVALSLVWIMTAESLGAWEPAAQAAVFFLAGAVLANLPAKARPKPAPAVVGVALWVLLGAFAPQLGSVIAWLVLPYAVLALGLRSTPCLRSAGRLGDVSYGTYLWGFVIQQTVAFSLPDAPLPIYLLITIPAVLAVAFASWHLVEKPVLTRVRRRFGHNKRRELSAPESSSAQPEYQSRPYV